TTQDPLGLLPDTNPYRYGGNDPTNATDPSGLFDVDATLAQVRERSPAVHAYLKAKGIRLQPTEPGLWGWLNAPYTANLEDGAVVIWRGQNDYAAAGIVLEYIGKSAAFKTWANEQGYQEAPRQPEIGPAPGCQEWFEAREKAWADQREEMRKCGRGEVY